MKKDGSMPSRSLLKLISNEADPPMSRGSFGYMVRQHRLMYRYTLDLVAKMANTSRTRIYQIEHKGVLPRSRKKLLILCECLEIPPVMAFKAVSRQRYRNEIRKDKLFLEKEGYRTAAKLPSDRVNWQWNRRERKFDIKEHVEADGETGSGDVRNQESPS